MLQYFCNYSFIHILIFILKAKVIATSYTVTVILVIIVPQSFNLIRDQKVMPFYTTSYLSVSGHLFPLLSFPKIKFRIRHLFYSGKTFKRGIIIWLKEMFVTLKMWWILTKLSQKLTQFLLSRSIRIKKRNNLLLKHTETTTIYIMLKSGYRNIKKIFQSS